MLLSKQLPPDAMENALHTIQRNARLQQKLIGDILDFSGIAIRKLSIEIQEVEIGEVAAQSIDGKDGTVTMTRYRRCGVSQSQRHRHDKGTGHVASAGPGQGATFVLTLPINYFDRISRRFSRNCRTNRPGLLIPGGPIEAD